jgi:hypothetical protein
MRLPRRTGLLGLSFGLVAAGLWLSVGIADAQSLPGAPTPSAVVKHTTSAVQSTTQAVTTAAPHVDPKPAAKTAEQTAAKVVTTASSAAAPKPSSVVTQAAQPARVAATTAVKSVQQAAPQPALQTVQTVQTAPKAVETVVAKAASQALPQPQPPAAIPPVVQTTQAAVTNVVAVAQTAAVEAVQPVTPEVAQVVDEVPEVPIEADVTPVSDVVEPLAEPVVEPSTPIVMHPGQSVEAPREPAPIAKHEEPATAAAPPVVITEVAAQVLSDAVVLEDAHLEQAAAQPANAMLRTSSPAEPPKLSTLTVASLEAAEPILPAAVPGYPSASAASATALNPVALQSPILTPDGGAWPQPASRTSAQPLHLTPLQSFALPTPAFEPLDSATHANTPLRLPAPPTTAPPPTAQSPGGGVNTLGSSNASAALPPGVSLIAATWRALAATSRQLPASISLPELAPPG